jgi:DNA-binding Xre family transcriptional regulator
MTSVEKVLKVLKERHIAVSRMERDLGFGNGYIRQLKKGTIPFDRLLSISSYLDVSINDILEDGQPHLLEMKEAATPKDDGALLRFALYGDPAEEITDEDIEKILDYARYVREKRKGDSE